MIDWTNALGLVAGACTTISVLPQIIKAWKTKEVEDVSAGMFAVLMTGVFLWLVYGIIRNDFPIIAANGASLTLNTFMLYLMMRYGRKNSKD